MYWGDDWLDNLEWCTYLENHEHAGREGLTTKCVPVTVFDTNTGLETRYASYKKCAQDLGITKDAVAWRASKGPDKVWPDGRRYKKTLDKKPWGDKVESSLGRKRVTFVKDIRINRVYIFGSLKEAAKALKINLGVAWIWASDEKQPLVPGFFLIQFQDIFKSWRTIGDPYAELQKTLNRKFIARLSNGAVEIFQSLTSCSKDSDIKPSTLHFHLNKRKEGITIGDYRYWYYDNLPEEFKTMVRLPSNG